MKLAISAAALAAVLVTVPVHAQASYKRDLPDSLKSKVKVAEGAAAKTALAKVPKGAIEGVELEREKGKIMYSYDIKVPGKKGVEEVNIDALTGKVLAMEHEDPATEKKEAADEAKKPAPAKPKKP
ncbi:MAG: PepSY domain-containing protein [Gemmatimonadaceae bacterium]